MDDWIAKVLNEDFTNNILDNDYKIFRQSSLLHYDFNSQHVEQYLISHEGELHKYVMIYDKTGDHYVHANPVYFPKSQVSTIRSYLLDGASLKIDQFERRQQEISSICRQLESFFGGKSFAKIFWTPANKRGLKVHFDPTSVFVIQLEGEKKWFLWDRVEYNPTQQMAKVIDEEIIGPPVQELILKAGDVLYIPAGMPHRAECEGIPSLHISIGLAPCKIVDLLKFAIEQQSHSNIAFRHPIISGRTNNELTKSQLNYAIDQLKKIDTEQLVKSYILAMNASRPDINNRAMYSLSNKHSLDKKSKIKKVESQIITIDINNESIRIYLSSIIIPEKPLLSSSPSYIELPIDVKIELKEILSGKELYIEDIPGELDMSSKVALVDYLMKFGLLELIELNSKTA